MPDPISAKQAEMPRHRDDDNLDRERPAAADDHLENHLLSEENTRLRAEVRRLEAVVKTCGRVLAPYFERPYDSARRR